MINSKISIDGSHINSQHQLAMISYWRNGYIQSIAAYIRRIDSLNRCITISNENGSQTMKLDFEVICNVE